MRFIRGGELFTVLRDEQKINEDRARFYTYNIALALGYLHSKQIIYRDLKPENLLLDDQNNIKIVDFGLSNMYQEGETLKTACGSPCYAAPEMIAGKKPGDKFMEYAQVVGFILLICLFVFAFGNDIYRHFIKQEKNDYFFFT